MTSVEHGDSVSHSQQHSDKQEPYHSPPTSPGVDLDRQGSYAFDNTPEVNEQRTTLHGQPITYSHDNHTNMMMAEGGGFGAGAGAAGANTLPPGYNDKSIVRVPIREADLGPEEGEGEQGAETYDSSIVSPEIQKVKKSWFSSFKAKAKGSTTSPRQKKREGGFKIVMMTRRDYLQYWAKGDDGKFLDNVQEPPEGRREWVREQLEKNEEWIKEDPKLAQGGNYVNANAEPKWGKPNPNLLASTMQNLANPLGFGQAGGS